MRPADPAVAAYLAALPPDRREAIEAVRAVILANLPAGYEEAFGYGGNDHVKWPHRDHQNWPHPRPIG